MGAEWPLQGLETGKVEGEGDRPFPRIQQNANVSSCGESLAANKQDCWQLGPHEASAKLRRKGQNVEEGPLGGGGGSVYHSRQKGRELGSHLGAKASDHPGWG